jgi:hypothetical protein
MTLWARLTWQAAGPDRLAADLARRLGIEARTGGVAPLTWVFDLGAAPLEVRPWMREGPGDEPRPWGRLVLEPIPGGEPSTDEAPTGGGGDAAGAPGAPHRMRLTAVGWATVDTDRAEADLDTWLDPPPEDGPDAGDDLHLGARVRLRGAGSLPGDWLAFLEPTTEGRAAASLARHGEGPCALYLHPADGLDAWLDWTRQAGVREWAGEPRPGPLGLEIALAGVPSAGPHVLVVERGTPPTPGARTSTIRV